MCGNKELEVLGDYFWSFSASCSVTLPGANLGDLLEGTKHWPLDHSILIWVTAAKKAEVSLWK